MFSNLQGSEHSLEKSGAQEIKSKNVVFDYKEGK